MTVEIRSMRFEVGGARDVLPAYAAALPERAALSPLGGLFMTEIGVLHTAWEFFWYPDRATRDVVAGEVSTLEGWPFDHPRIIERSATLVLEDAPFNPPFEPGEHGGFYELRQYELAAGTIDSVIAAWGSRIDARRAISPFLGAWWSNAGDVDVFVHLWGYSDLVERQRARHEAMSAGIWPPPSSTPLRQESSIILPTPFSPLR